MRDSTTFRHDTQHDTRHDTERGAPQEKEWQPEDRMLRQTWVYQDDADEDDDTAVPLVRLRLLRQRANRRIQRSPWRYIIEYSFRQDVPAFATDYLTHATARTYGDRVEEMYRSRTVAVLQYDTAAAAWHRYAAEYTTRRAGPGRVLVLPPRQFAPRDAAALHARRAERAEVALRAYGILAYDAVDMASANPQMAVGDLLCDLLHLADTRLGEPGAVLRAALHHYAVERRAAAAEETAADPEVVGLHDAATLAYAAGDDLLRQYGDAQQRAAAAAQRPAPAPLRDTPVRDTPVRDTDDPPVPSYLPLGSANAYTGNRFRVCVTATADDEYVPPELARQAWLTVEPSGTGFYIAAYANDPGDGAPDLSAAVAMTHTEFYGGEVRLQVWANGDCDGDPHFTLPVTAQPGVEQDFSVTLARVPAHVPAPVPVPVATEYATLLASVRDLLQTRDLEREGLVSTEAVLDAIARLESLVPPAAADTDDTDDTDDDDDD